MENAFEQTQKQMKEMATHQAQNPQIDVNGNAIATAGSEGLGSTSYPGRSLQSVPASGFCQPTASQNHQLGREPDF
ncbi:TPA: hypothetical protein EYN98_03000 [Candidatus Poribacteria bacterium]|nr:hypothetical protein [Candidatus Poribacteria bacterium]HIC02624.1 hypothetical protein [Candidatus Poribacteria bacterium]